MSAGVATAGENELIGPGSTNKSAIYCIQFAYWGVAGRNLTHESGVYGKDTEQATRDFQQWFGLPVDGIVGPQTGQVLGYMIDRWNDQYEAAGCHELVPGA